MLLTHFSALLGSASTLLGSALALPGHSRRPYGSTCDTEVITRDVLVVGGGSSGTYGATRLHQMNKTVVIVEKVDRLGGQTQTYTDPMTGLKSDIGVIVWHNTSTVTDYFAYYDVPLTLSSFAGNMTTDYVDFRTGETVVGYQPANPATALEAYAEQLAKYAYVEEGFDLPYPVPADLLLPFKDFVAKYNLGDMVLTAFSYGQGLGDFLNHLTLYVFKNFGLGVVESLETGFVTTARHDNSEIYENAQAMFSAGGNVLLNSVVVDSYRTADADGYMTFIVKSEGNCVSVVRAKQVLISIQPVVSALAPFDLCAQEVALFEQFNSSSYWTGLLRSSGIPDTVQVQNTGADTLYNLPVLPGSYIFSPSGIPDVQHVYYGAEYDQTEDEVKANIFDSLAKLNSAGTIQTTVNQTTFATLESHNPFEFVVSATAVENGFYKQLYALQGERNTFWTGAAWHTQDSSLLWEFTDKIVMAMVAAS